MAGSLIREEEEEEEEGERLERPQSQISSAKNHLHALLQVQQGCHKLHVQNSVCSWQGGKKHSYHNPVVHRWEKDLPSATPYSHRTSIKAVRAARDETGKNQQSMAIPRRLYTPKKKKKTPPDPQSQFLPKRAGSPDASSTKEQGRNFQMGVLKKKGNHVSRDVPNEKNPRSPTLPRPPPQVMHETAEAISRSLRQRHSSTHTHIHRATPTRTAPHHQHQHQHQLNV